MVKNPPSAKAGDSRDTDLIPGLGRSSGVGNGYPLQNSCLENGMVRGDWRATAHGFPESIMNEHATHTHSPVHQQYQFFAPEFNCIRTILKQSIQFSGLEPTAFPHGKASHIPCYPYHPLHYYQTLGSLPARVP